jgi:flagellar biosynthesis regulator FlaF
MLGASKSGLTETLHKIEKIYVERNVWVSCIEDEILTVHGLIHKLIFLSSYELLTRR